MGKVKLSQYYVPNERQREAHQYIGKGVKLFYGGARGGGKSHYSLAAGVISCLSVPYLSAVVIRSTYPELEDNYIRKIQTLYPPDVFGYIYRDKKKLVTFRNGATLTFRAVATEEDTKKVQGIEYQLMIIDEAPNFEEETINRLSGSLRRNKMIPKTFLPTLIMTGNPGGRSDHYFKTRYINPDYSLWRKSELKNKEKYIFVPAKVDDNPYVGEEYIEWLESLPEHLREAWRNGNWDIFEGKFFEGWSNAVHVVPKFDIPENWHRVGGLDLGYTDQHPTCLYLMAQNPDTQEIYVYYEYSASGPTEKFINEITEILKAETQQVAIYADPSMWNSSTKQSYADDSPAMMFMRAGIPLLKANNDRINGWRVMKQWLNWTATREPKLKFFETCQFAIRTLPEMRYSLSKTALKAEDCDTRGQDDAGDALRYALMSGFGYPVEGISYDGPAKQAIDSIEKEARRADRRYKNIQTISRYANF